MLADRDRLGQVLANLLTNAVKSSPPGSEVLVRVRRGAGEAQLAVVDQGTGIPAGAPPRLFDRFYRVAATAGRARGPGLGLDVSRRVVEAHGGRIAVASEVAGAAPSPSPCRSRGPSPRLSQIRPRGRSPAPGWPYNGPRSGIAPPAPALARTQRRW